MMRAQTPPASSSGSEGSLNSADVEAEAEALRLQLRARQAARRRTEHAAAAQVWLKLHPQYGRQDCVILFIAYKQVWCCCGFFHFCYLSILPVLYKFECRSLNSRRLPLRLRCRRGRMLEEALG